MEISWEQEEQQEVLTVEPVEADVVEASVQAVEEVVEALEELLPVGDLAVEAVEEAVVVRPQEQAWEPEVDPRS